MRFPGFSRAHLWTNPLFGPCVYLSSSPESVLAACVDAGSVRVQVWVYGLCDPMGSAEELLDDLSLSTVSVGVAPVGLMGAGSDPSGALLKILPCRFTPKCLFGELPVSLCFKCRALVSAWLVLRSP